MGEGDPADHGGVRAERQRYGAEQAVEARKRQWRREEAQHYEWDWEEEPMDVDQQSEAAPEEELPVTPGNNEKKRPLPTGGSTTNEPTSEQANGSRDNPQGTWQKTWQFQVLGNRS